MIAKDNGTGKSFIGIGAYLAVGRGGEKPERVEWSEGINLPTNDIAAASAIMRAHANDNTRVDKPVYHFSINWHPLEGEEVDQAKAMSIMRETLAELGLQEHQALIVAHNDTEHFHIHAVVNRIHPETKKSWKQGLSKIALEKTMARLSLEHGFELVAGHHNANELGIEPPNSAESVPSEVLRFEERTGEDSDLTRARKEILPDLAEAKSWDDLSDRLAAKGYAVQANGRGMSFVRSDGSFIKASAIGRQFSRAKVEEKFKEDFRSFAERNDRGAGPAPENSGTSVGSVDPMEKLVRDATSAIKTSSSWKQLEYRLSRAGIRMRAQGHGLYAKRYSKEVQFGDLGPAFRKSALEERFGERYADYRSAKRQNEKTEAQQVARAHAVNLAVYSLQDFDRKTQRLYDLTKDRERVMVQTERTYQHFRAIGDAKKVFEAEFSNIYRDPDKAAARYEKLVKKKSFNHASDVMAKSPKKFGRLKGRGLFGASADRREVQESLKKIKEASTSYTAAVEALGKLGDRRIAADKRRRDQWRSHNAIDTLKSELGFKMSETVEKRDKTKSEATEAERRETFHGKRQALERRILDISAGVALTELAAVPEISKLRQASIAETVERLRAQDVANRADGDLSAFFEQRRERAAWIDHQAQQDIEKNLPKDQVRTRAQLAEEWKKQIGDKALKHPGVTRKDMRNASEAKNRLYSVTHDYARAREEHKVSISGWQGSKPINTELSKTLTDTANTLIASKDGNPTKYLREFGLTRKDLLTDATKVPFREKAPALAKRLDAIRANLRAAGQGITAGLSLTRRL